MPQTATGRSEDLLAELAEWVKIESPTTHAPAVNRVVDLAEAELTRAGAAITRIPGRGGYGDNLIARTSVPRNVPSNVPSNVPGGNWRAARPAAPTATSWWQAIWTRSGTSARCKPCRIASTARRRTAPASTT